MRRLRRSTGRRGRPGTPPANPRNQEGTKHQSYWKPANTNIFIAIISNTTTTTTTTAEGFGQEQKIISFGVQ